MKKNLTYSLMCSFLLTVFVHTYAISEDNKKEKSFKEPSKHSLSNQKIFSGKCENNLSYTILPSEALDTSVWIHLTYSKSPLIDENLEKLMQYALFFGSNALDRESIALTLSELNLDVDPVTHWRNNEKDYSLELYLEDQEGIQKTLLLMNEICFNASLSDQAIEQARNQLLKQNPLNPLDSLNIDTNEVRRHYACWLSQQEKTLTIIGNIQTDHVYQAVDTIFKQIQPHQEISQSDLNEAVTPLLHSIALASNDTVMIDGKILMKKPNWLNEQKNGRKLGTILGIMGFFCAGLGFFIFPALPLSLIPFIATGFLYLSPYTKDPHYLENMRRIDLVEGMIKTYSTNRSHLTLTPLERRISFLDQMVNRPESLSKAPILVLSDDFKLNDPVITAMFTIEEYNYLKQLRSDFIYQRNHYKSSKTVLEKELAQKLAPYEIAEKAALSQAQYEYDQNPYVVSLASYNKEIEEKKAEVEKLYKNKSISAEQKNEYLLGLTKTDEYIYFNSVEFKSLLASAKNQLNQSIAAAKSNYLYQVEQCKISIDYYNRRNGFKGGKSYLIHSTSKDLVAFLRTFPMHLTCISDFIDLRYPS